MERHDVAVGRRDRIHLGHRIPPAAGCAVVGPRAGDGDVHLVGRQEDEVDEPAEDEAARLVGHRPHVAHDVDEEARVLPADDLVAGIEPLALARAAAVRDRDQARTGRVVAERGQLGAERGAQRIALSGRARRIGVVVGEHLPRPRRVESGEQRRRLRRVVGEEGEPVLDAERDRRSLLG